MITYEVHKHIPKINPKLVNSSIINYVIYSHSSFLDILQIQTDYIAGKGNLTLLINENNLDLKHIYEKYDNIIYYKDGISYGHKLLSCINQLDCDYFLFIHDNDILFDVDNTKLLEFLSFLRENNFDRIDFQLAYDFNRTNKETIEDDELYLIKSSNIDTTANGYIFNVNPSIWKRETLIKILNNYGHRDYRTIEHPEVQEFCLQFNIFKLFSKKTFNCGYFICLEPFKYLHITHSGHILSLNHLSEESCKDIKEEYTKIIDKYKLNKSVKWIG